MSVREVVIHVPSEVYEHIRHTAEHAGRPLENVLVEAVVAAAPSFAGDTFSLRVALAQMPYLNDAALWQAARTTAPPAYRERLEALHDKQQREGLTAVERDEEQQLFALYRETVLVRARAAALLKQRGYDVADPDQFAPLG